MTTFRDSLSSRLGIIVFLGLLISTLLLVLVGRETHKKQNATDQEITTKLATLEESLTEARDTRNALQQDLDKMTRERVDVDGELTRLKLELEKKDAELAKQQESLTSADAENAKAIARLSVLEKELETVRAEAKAETAAAESEAAKIRKNADAAALEWAQTKGNLEQQLHLAKLRLEALENSDEQVEIAHLKNRTVQLEQKLDTLGNQRNEMARMLRAMRGAAAAPPKAAAAPAAQ